MKTKNLTRFLALLLALLLPGAVLLTAGLCIPAQFGHTFLGALAPKYERLIAFEEPKIVVVGGSSVAFGLDSPLLEELIGRPVINFGLYASLGTKVMLDLSRAGINEGDIIILAPEIEKQTLSLYFNPESTWQAVEACPAMLTHIAPEDLGAMYGGFFDYLGSKFTFFRDGTPDPDGVYNSRNFNSYGDISYDRPYNTMLLGYDPNMQIVLSRETVDPEFIDYVNEYAAFAEKKGASVYYSFPPMNEAALAEDTNEATIYDFYDYLSRNLDCPVISNPEDYIYESGYFFDTNFHLNESGIVLRTAALAADLRRVMGDPTPVDVELPPAPEKPVVETPSTGDTVDRNAMAAYFTYSDVEGGLMVSGVTDEGKKLTSITVPASYEGKPVLAIAENTFSGCTALQEIVIYDNVKQYFDGAFRGASSLSRVVMYYATAESVLVGEKLFDGAPDTVKLYYPDQDSFANFVSDYFWGTLFSDRMDLLS